jgi:hypothetical protein
VTARVTLAEPGDLSGFPVGRQPARLLRVCRSANGTWWYSSDGSGRFDLERPEGTCYFATDRYGAIREATRLGPVTPGWVAEREVCYVSPPNPRARLAATTWKAAGAYGVTNELATLVPYDVPRRWATAFRTHGFDGIRHQLRHDQRARPGGIALFGPAGAGSTPDGERRPLDAAAVEAAGVRIIDPPHSTVLTVVP